MRVEFIPKRTTAKYQALYLVLIAHGKIRYMSEFLRRILNVILEVDYESGPALSLSSDRENLGLQDGCLSHICDAMTVFDESWSKTTRSTVIKCCIKNQCLPEAYVSRGLSIIEGSSHTVYVDDLVQAVYQSEA